MCCRSFWKKAVPFAIALMLGVLVASFFQKAVYRVENQPIAKSDCKFNTGYGIGTGGGGGREVNIETMSRTGTNAVQILSKPKPAYTNAARQNQTQGKVSLRVTFLASGHIGSVKPVKSLPDGLTEQAMVAALNIKFEPATKDGEPVTVTKTVEYNFTIY